MRSLSRWLPLVAALAWLTALTPGAASAQPPCVPAIIDDYIDLLATGPGGGCRVGPLTFSDFHPVTYGATGYLDPRGRVFLRPVDVLIRQRPFVGFTVELLAPFDTDWLRAIALGDRCPDPSLECYLDVQHTDFGFRAVGPELLSYAAGNPIGSAFAAGNWEAGYGVGVNPVADPGQPVPPGVMVFHSTFAPVCVGGPQRCPDLGEELGRSPVDRYEAYVETYSRNYPHLPGTAGGAGTVQISAQVLFGIVPEPSAVALAATGLLALGVGACRRRGRHTL